MSEKLTGAQIMCEALIREGVEVMFGIPGGTIMPFYYAMYDYQDQLRHILCRHEQGAGHAADGYARASGKVGVCIGTSGPGSTNLVTAIANAYMDSTPIVAVTGQVATSLIGRDAFQETDVTGITMPITKHNYLVKDIEELPRVFKEAFYIASTGRTGPVLIDIAKDVQQSSTVPNWNVELNLPGYHPDRTFDHEEIRDAIALLTEAKKPLMIIGNGVLMSGATEEVRQFAEHMGVPVVTTLHGIGGFPEDHPLSLGMPGMHGWVHVNRAIQECDVLFNVGSRFDDRVTGKMSTFAPNARIIHVDIDESEIGKNIRTDIGIVGDARAVLQEMLKEMPQRDTHEWVEYIRQMQEKHQPKQHYMQRPPEASLMPYDVFTTLSRIINERGNYRVVADVGQHQMWTAQLIDWHKPRTHFSSGGLGTMGFGLPTGMGVAVAKPNDTVWVIAGDGGFQMTNQELQTIVQEGIKNIKVAIINNGYLGMVRQWQELFENKRYSGTPLSCPDFPRLAEAYGIRGLAVDQASAVEDAINSAYEHDGPMVIDFRVEREVNVFPMVPQGKSIGEMIVGAPNPVPEVPRTVEETPMPIETPLVVKG
ncbi:MAG: biosynthetic-type acetolactate synthase large subunit [Chloroflexaceae bacterium]|nr:biosynthetic-type acetolactate synthase large subunit [Chloroflexaceae bacterium]